MRYALTAFAALLVGVLIGGALPRRAPPPRPAAPEAPAAQPGPIRVVAVPGAPGAPDPWGEWEPVSVTTPRGQTATGAPGAARIAVFYGDDTVVHYTKPVRP